jgi:hypothetical protein
MWERLFDTLLNAASPAAAADLLGLQAVFVAFLQPRSRDLAAALTRLRGMLAGAYGSL